jgi:hypothetical protein
MEHEIHTGGEERVLAVAAREHLERALVADGPDRSYHIRAALQYLAPGVERSPAPDGETPTGDRDTGRGD